jgi:hypothetical protein
MDGLLTMIYPTIKYRISGLLALLVALLLAVPAAAQGSREARVELATVDSDGALVVHVAVPRGQTVEAASLTVEGATVNLQPEPAPLAVNRWILLDSGETVVNTATNTQAALQRFLQTTDADNRTGLVIYAGSSTLYAPTDSLTELQLLLDDYNARVSEPGCIGDALVELAQRERPLDRARRVLVIAGPLSRQGLCDTESYTAVGAPVDQLIITEEMDDLYLDIQERSGGALFRANIRTVDARLNDVSALWAQPSYRLDGTLTVAGDVTEVRGSLSVTLANNTQETFDVTITVVAGEEGAQVFTLGGPPTATTVPPTAVAVLPTDVPTTAPAATADTSSAEGEATEPVVTPVPPTEVPPTEAAAPTESDTDDSTPTEVAVVAGNPTSVPPTEVPPTDSDPEPTTVAQAEIGDDGTAAEDLAGEAPAATGLMATIQSTDPILLVGVGLVVLGIIGGLLFLLVLRRPEALNTVTGSFATSGTAATGPGQQTFIEPMQTTIAAPDALDNPGPRGPRAPIDVNEDYDAGHTEIDPLFEAGGESGEADVFAGPDVPQKSDTLIDPMFGGDDMFEQSGAADTPAPPQNPDTFDIYSLYEQDDTPTPPGDDDDEIDLTEVVTDEELMPMGYDDEDDKTEIVTEDELLQTRPLIGYLKVVGTDARYELRPETVTLGRNADNDIVLNDEKKISRHHLRFEVSHDGQVVVHILTKNAVVHNGESVHSASFTLEADDQIRLTPNVLLEYEPAE